MKIGNFLAFLIVLSTSNNFCALSIPSSAYHLAGGVVATCVSAYLTRVTYRHKMLAEKKFADVCNQLKNMGIVVEKYTTLPGPSTVKTTFYLKPLNPELKYDFEQCSVIRECSQELVTNSYEIGNQANYCAFATFSTIVSTIFSCCLMEDFLKDLKKISL